MATELDHQARGAGTAVLLPRAAEAIRGFLAAAPDAVLVVDESGRIVMLNALTERMFGYSPGELLGLKVESLVPLSARPGHTRHRRAYGADPRTRPMGEGRSLAGRRKDGSEFPVEISLSPLATESGALVVSIVRDVTSRRAAEEQMKASLREKEVLLREIHHRVKNNLQVTSSLLRLQSATLDDPKAKEAFAESQSRIRSMALVHEKLYQSTDLSRIDVSDYAQSLGLLLFRSYGVASRIALRVEGGPVFLSVETAVPCGLILNELLSNALKHAFPGGLSGEVVVEVQTLPAGRFALTVRDDGVGMPSGVAPESSETLGLQLVRTLVDQLHGELSVRDGPGTAFRIELPETR